MSREAMQLALELIEPIAHNSTDDPRGKAYEAITALRQALEQPASPDLSKLTPANQQQMHEWLADGSFAQRAIDTMFSLSEEITALKKQQEPVAWLDPEENRADEAFTWSQFKQHTVPLYTAPPQKQWVGLTDEERHSIREWQEIQKELGPVWAPMMLYLYEAIEAKLKEKNSG